MVSGVEKFGFEKVSDQQLGGLPEEALYDLVVKVVVKIDSSLKEVKNEQGGGEISGEGGKWEGDLSLGDLNKVVIYLGGQ